MSIEFLELFVRYTDGTGGVEVVMENSEHNRVRMDKYAHHFLARHSVESCTVERATRVAGYLKSGKPGRTGTRAGKVSAQWMIPS